jgi:hypothetical protein
LALKIRDKAEDAARTAKAKPQVVDEEEAAPLVEDLEEDSQTADEFRPNELNVKEKLPEKLD